MRAPSRLVAFAAILGVTFGTAALAWMIPLAWICERGVRRAGLSNTSGTAREPAAAHWSGRSRLQFQIVLFLGVLLVSLAAHLGGALVYGEDYFTF